MTLSISDSKKGAVIRGEVQFGQILLVNFEEAYNLVHRDINKIQEWAPNLISCSILDNRFESWEVGARRRSVINKNPYRDVVIREILTEKGKTQSRASVKFTYSPLDGEEKSFSALRLDSRQKIANAMAQKGPLADPEPANVSEALHYGNEKSHSTATTSSSNVNKYALDEVADEPLLSRGSGGTAFAPIPPRSSSASAISASSPSSSSSTNNAALRNLPPLTEAPTLLSFTTTYSFNALSGGIATTGKAPQIGSAAGELRCFMEILVEYTLSCETPGEHDERLLYDHRVLRDFLDKFWVRGLAESFANYAHAQAYHLTDGFDPLRGPTAGYGAINIATGTYRGSGSGTGGSPSSPQRSVLGGPSDARVKAVADQLGLRFAEEQEQYDSAVSLLAAKAKTAEDDRLAETMLKLLASWERVTGELKRSQEMVERVSHELDAARLITSAATGLSAATERGRVLYDYEEAKKL